MDDIERRILDAAIELATEGGFDAVRQRAVAAKAEVALGTLYSRFEGKNLLLASALVLESERVALAVEAMPLRGRTPVSRVTRVFERLTERFISRPNLARAILRSAATGERESTLRLMTAQGRTTLLVAAALRGSPTKPDMSEDAAQQVATILVMVWFPNLIAWAGGVATPGLVVDVVRQTAELLLHGVETG